MADIRCHRVARLVAAQGVSAGGVDRFRISASWLPALYVGGVANERQGRGRDAPAPSGRELWRALRPDRHLRVGSSSARTPARRRVRRRSLRHSRSRSPGLRPGRPQPPARPPPPEGRPRQHVPRHDRPKPRGSRWAFGPTAANTNTSRPAGTEPWYRLRPAPRPKLMQPVCVAHGARLRAAGPRPAGGEACRRR